MTSRRDGEEGMQAGLVPFWLDAHGNGGNRSLFEILGLRLRMAIVLCREE